MITLHTSNNQGALELRDVGFSTVVPTGEGYCSAFEPLDRSIVPSSSEGRHYRSTFDKMKTGPHWGAERNHDCTHRKVSLDLYPKVTSVSGDMCAFDDHFGREWAERVGRKWIPYRADEFRKHTIPTEGAMFAHLSYLKNKYTEEGKSAALFTESLNPTVNVNASLVPQYPKLAVWENHPAAFRFWCEFAQSTPVVYDEYSYYEVFRSHGVLVLHISTIEFQWKIKSTLAGTCSCSVTIDEGYTVQVANSTSTSKTYFIPKRDIDWQNPGEEPAWKKYSSTDSGRTNYGHKTMTLSGSAILDNADVRQCWNHIVRDDGDWCELRDWVKEISLPDNATTYLPTPTVLHDVYLQSNAVPRLTKELKHKIDKQYPDFIKHQRLGKPTHTELADLDDKCIDQCRNCDINSIAYLRDIKDFGSTVKAFYDALTGRKFDAKTLSSLWLSGRYADRLTIKDTEELVTAIRRAAKQLKSTDWTRRVHSRHNDPASVLKGGITASRWYTSEVCYMPKDVSPLMTGLRKLQDWDLWPTLDNIWDLIPYSFVVDWFVDVGSILQRIDQYAYLQYLDVLWVIRGVKETYSFDVDWSLYGWEPATITYTYYGRTHTSHLYQPDLRIQTGSFRSVNMIDGAALLWQRS